MCIAHRLLIKMDSTTSDVISMLGQSVFIAHGYNHTNQLANFIIVA